MEAVRIYEYVMEQLHAVSGEPAFEEVAAGSGVPKSTVKKIKWKQIKDPGVSHIEALANYFQQRNAAKAGGEHGAASVPASG